MKFGGGNTKRRRSVESTVRLTRAPKLWILDDQVNCFAEAVRAFSVQPVTDLEKLLGNQRLRRCVRWRQDSNGWLLVQPILSLHNLQAILLQTSGRVTATPMLNKTADMLGYLELLWKNEWFEEKYTQEPDCPMLHDHDLMLEEYARLSAGDENGPFACHYWLLNPKYFSRMRVEGDLTATTAVNVIPNLFRRLCQQNDGRPLSKESSAN